MDPTTHYTLQRNTASVMKIYCFINKNTDLIPEVLMLNAVLMLEQVRVVHYRSIFFIFLKLIVSAAIYSGKIGVEWKNHFWKKSWPFWSNVLENFFGSILFVWKIIIVYHCLRLSFIKIRVMCSIN